MTGYFSRLIQQTGIRVERQSGSQGTPVSLDPRSTATQEANSTKAAELLEMEEVKVIAPQSESSAPDTGVSSATEIAVNPPQVSSVPQSFEMPVERKSIVQPSHPIAQRTEQGPEQRTPESISPRPEIVIQEVTAPIQTPINQNIEKKQDKQTPQNIEKKQNQQTPRNFSQAHPVPEVAEIEIFQEHPVTKTGLDRPAAEEAASAGELNQKSRSPQTRHDYWQVVHEWVAGKPQTDEEVRNVEVSLGRDSLEPPETVIVQEELQQPQGIPEIGEILDTARVENQELVLSIGSIQVTVEETPTEVQRPAATVPQPAPRAQASLESSRLRRHYIRFR